MFALLKKGAVAQCGRSRSVSARALFLGALLVALAAAAMTGRASAQTDPKVSVELERNPVSVGDELDVFVFVENAEDLAAFQFTMAYDEAAVDYISVDLGPFLESGGRDVTPIGPIELPGSVTMAAISIPGTGNGATGSGDLAILRFKALSAGDTVLDLTEVLLENTEGSRDEVDGVDAVLSISPAATPTPTPEPTPTAAPRKYIHLPRADNG